MMHGYTVDDIHHATRSAVSTKLYFAADRQDLYTAAWDGIIDLLCTVTEQPRWFDLVRAGEYAIYRLREDWAHHHGYVPGIGTGAAVNFRKYWASSPNWQSQLEDTVVERVAKRQILRALPDNELRALVARGATNSHQQAAEAAGLTYIYMTKLIRNGRKRFLALWHQHETPVIAHRKQHMRRAVEHQPCGTPAGYQRHRRRLEPACEACRAAVNDYESARRKARAEVVVDQPGGGSS